MLSPPAHLAKDGRINPVGIPYLYTSDKKLAAISELRPWVGAKICLAELLTNRDLFVFNAIPENIDKMDKDSKIILNCINELFSQPIYSEDRASYAPSQYLSEFIKKHGYDGIRYKSTLCNKGNNIALFNQCNVSVSDLFDVNVTEANFNYELVYSHKEWLNNCLDRLKEYANKQESD
jgi:hypothetical protein